ncbi:MAG: hypothetical protein GX862_10795, partial [Leucobacter sp.]|nr:hypothetical protein [Leucobacter sp.]
MKAFHKQLRGSLAATLSAALILSGVLLSAPTAYADETDAAAAAASAQVAETPADEQVAAQSEEQPAGTADEGEPAGEAAAGQVPADEAPAEEAPTEGPADEVPADAPADGYDAANAAKAPTVQKRSVSALAAGPTVTVESLEASAAGLEAEFKATGLPGAIYGAIIERGTDAEVGMGGGYVAFAHPFPTVTNGEATFSLTAPTAVLDRTKQYEIVVWRAHSAITEVNVYARATLDVTVAQWNVLFPPGPPRVEVVGDVTDLDPSVSNTVTVKGYNFFPDGAATNGGRPPLA